MEQLPIWSVKQWHTPYAGLLRQRADVRLELELLHLAVCLV